MYRDLELERDWNGTATGLLREQPDGQAIEEPYKGRLTPVKDRKLVRSGSQADPKQILSEFTEQKQVCDSSRDRYYRVII